MFILSGEKESKKKKAANDAAVPTSKPGGELLWNQQVIDKFQFGNLVINYL